MSTPARHRQATPVCAAAVCGTRRTPSRQEDTMAHIRCTLRPHFTGQVGPVRFRNGHGETSDPEALAYFEANPDEYDVTVDDVPAFGPQPNPQSIPLESHDVFKDTDPQE